MGIIELIAYIAIVGLIVWAITTLVPMPEPFKRAIYVIAVVALAIFVLHALGILGHFHDIKLSGK